MNYAKKYFIFILMIFLSIILIACTDNINNNTNNTNANASNNSLQTKYYSILSSIDFNESLCSSTGYGTSENGSNYGLRIIIKDKDTNKILNGYATYTSNIGEGGVSVDKTYTCEENIMDNAQYISVYSQGYSPLVFVMSPSKNSLTTIEVAMIKSCTGAPSCFDNFEIQNSWIKNSNKTHYDELLNDYKNSFYNIIDKTLEINKTDYTLQCMECDMDRGGYVKAKGTLNDGSDLNLYYHWGWCSSGGSDCGYDVCISTIPTRTSEDFISDEQNNYCNNLNWNGRNDNNSCTSEEFNNDTIIRDECMNGTFENIDSGRWTLALAQSSGRCSSSVSNISYNCIGN